MKYVFEAIRGAYNTYDIKYVIGKNVDSYAKGLIAKYESNGFLFYKSYIDL